jgi:hypothetical protein
MKGQKLTLASLYFACFVITYNLYHLDELYGLLATFSCILLFSHQQVERENQIKQIEDELTLNYWGVEQ